MREILFPSPAAAETVLLDFTASWCSACQQMAPIVARLKAAGYPVREINVDRDKQTPARYKVGGCPTFVMVALDREVGRIVGGTTYEALEALCRKGQGTVTPVSLPRGPPRISSQASVVRICVSTRGMKCYGSGTVIESGPQRAVVLTCAHLFREGNDRTDVQCCGGWGIGRVLGIDEAWDLAAIEISPCAASEVQIASSYPKPGETVTSSGFGPTDRYLVNTGRVLGYARGGGPTYETLQLTGSAREGDSGGPVLNTNGELVAVLWGTDGRTVAGTYCGRIRKFLDRLRLRSGKPPASSGPCCPAAGQPAIAAQPPTPGPETILPEGSPAGGGEAPAWQPPQIGVPAVQSPDLAGIRADLATIGVSLDKLDRGVSALCNLGEQHAQDLSAIRAKLDTVPPAANAQPPETQPPVTQLPAPEPSSPTAQPAPVAPAPPPAAPLSPAATAIGAAAETGLSAWLLALGVPGGIAGVGAAAAVWLAKRAASKVVAGAASAAAPVPQASSPSSAATSAGVLGQTPPPPQVTVRDTAYVPYEIATKRQRATEMAMDEMVKRYPGARTTIDLIQSFARQFESGLTRP